MIQPLPSQPSHNAIQPLPQAKPAQTIPTPRESGIKLNLDVFNILNTQASQIDYFYTSRLPGEPAEGVADRHFHPVEPTAFRLTLAKAF